MFAQFEHISRHRNSDILKKQILYKNKSLIITKTLITKKSAIVFRLNLKLINSNDRNN